MVMVLVLVLALAIDVAAMHSDVIVIEDSRTRRGKSTGGSVPGC